MSKERFLVDLLLIQVSRAKTITFQVKWARKQKIKS